MPWDERNVYTLELDPESLPEDMRPSNTDPDKKPTMVWEAYGETEDAARVTTFLCMSAVLAQAGVDMPWYRYRSLEDQ